MRTILLLVGVLTLAGCYRDNDPNLPPEELTGDVDASDPCTRACARLEAVGCPEGRPSRGGVTCTSVCGRNADILPLACIGKATSVATVRACGVGCGR